ncbi:MAG: BamA/TamA family outer membrane protein [Proteobacteria bacterium]|nr:BamA/TamA family outer membrane protein [Pseudomonadota bacterium]
MVASPVLATAAEDAPVQLALTEPEEEFDPFEGIDPDGRIPTVERPPELPNPGRWRYIPEGRIKPGNVLQRFLVSSFIAPFVTSDSDVGTGGGLALTDIDFRRQRRREFAGAFVSYTSKGQRSGSFLWRRWLHHIDLPTGGVLQEERSFVGFGAGYRRSLTRRFFGLGDDTEESDETSYTDEVFDAEIELNRSLPKAGSDWVLRVGLRGEFHELSDGRVSGRPDTEDVFPELFADAEDHNLGYLNVGLRWDTRDSQRQPYTGFVLEGFVDAALVQRGGDVGARYTLEASKVFRVPGLFHSGGDPDEEHPPTDSLAFGLLTQTTSGDLPFFALPTLGGSVRHRGFIEGRFRDRSAWLGVVEYRPWVIARGIPITRTIRIERIGVGLFYELGSVADDWPDLFEAKLHQSYGAGLRFSLERSAIFRVDLGFSEDGLNVGARFGLSF